MSSKRVYLAGELFDLKHLVGNALLAELIEEESSGELVPVLPQDLELPSLDPEEIRRTDCKALLECDAAVFFFDGTDLDSGTVAEFTLAKTADIPVVLVRTDFRKAGDRNRRPWNLMCDFFPRCEYLLVDAMANYSEERMKEAGSAWDAAKDVTRGLAGMIIEKLDTVVATESVLEESERESVEGLLERLWRI